MGKVEYNGARTKTKSKQALDLVCEYLGHQKYHSENERCNLEVAEAFEVINCYDLNQGSQDLLTLDPCCFRLVTLGSRSSFYLPQPRTTFSCDVLFDANTIWRNEIIRREPSGRALIGGVEGE